MSNCGPQPLELGRVRVSGGFWAGRQRINREVTIPVEYAQCETSGRIGAFELNWRPGDPNPPHFFYESDVAKWLEAAAYSLRTHPDPELAAKVERVAGLIIGAQQPDGYLNIYFTVVEPEKRWTNLRDWHELYCAGHLMEAAVAHHETTGRRELLDCLCRFADCIGAVFGPGADQQHGYPGHQEIELALVRLWRATGERRYLELAAFFLDARGTEPHYFIEEARARGEAHPPAVGDHDYWQAHAPVREQATAEGHAVRACYMYAGMADVARETGDAALAEACRLLWANIVERRMYVTGGVGSSRFGERFTFDHDLPNEEAYAESCAAIALVLFARRMHALEPHGEYYDVIERALYNGVIAGVSLDGRRFFYDNYLASQPGAHRFSGQKPPVRQEWFGCACCPPNLARIIAAFGEYLYSADEEHLYVNMYATSDAQVDIAGGHIQLTQATDYPWDGRIELTIRADAPRAFTLRLRRPGWCREPRATLNGEPLDLAERGGYLTLQRTWHDDRIVLDLPMPIERIEAHPSVRHDAGRVALMRGPLVYCLEQVDNGPDLNDLALPREAELSAVADPAAFAEVPGAPAGAVFIEGRARRRRLDGWEHRLYRPAGSATREVPLRAVPYFMWANRGAGEMLVWVREGA